MLNKKQKATTSMAFNSSFIIQHSAILLLFLTACSTAHEADFQINLWPSLPPGETADRGPETLDGNDIANVSTPTLTLWRAHESPAPALIIFPGGGFKKVVVKKEGEDIARWLNSTGITAIVVKYRVPFPPGKPKDSMAIQDAQRALCVVRAHAAQWNIDPNRIGVIGFSAGGRLVADVSTNFDKLSYSPVDEMDAQSTRPALALALYPGDLTPSDDTDRIDPQLRPTKQTPPTFIAMSQNDITRDEKNGTEHALYYYLALNKAGVSAELHIFSDGVHGFALRPSPDPHAYWTTLAINWMKYHGFLAALPSTNPTTRD
ncbi:MAG: alpha/beta hydrolase [Tepidisphaeraceae bacterium]|jgi:acetyl esterase/lipase